MSSRRGLERRLADLAGFEDPRVALEQYPTPADVAAHLLHVADMQGDLEETIIDLGSGTGVLALAAAIREPNRVIGVERDGAALSIARENERRLDPPVAVTWIRSDATRAPLCVDSDTGRTGKEHVTVVMNPPFGAQNANVHADRRFLETVVRIADVSYSIHNAGSRDFVEAFAADHGGAVTHAFEVRLDVDAQFPFHDSDREEIAAEAFRIEWER